MGGEQRGYDGGKKIRGRKPHLLVDTEGFVLKAKVHSAKIMRWLQRGEDKGADWIEKTLGWTVELLERPRKAAPKEVLMAWTTELAKEGMKVNLQKLIAPRGFQILPRRWVVEHTIAWISDNRRMSKDCERLCASGEAFVYAARIRLMARRLACS